MPIDELRKCIIATPFQPFILNIGDGRRIPVAGLDFILIPPEKGRIVLVYQRHGDFDILDAMLINDVSFESGEPPA